MNIIETIKKGPSRTSFREKAVATIILLVLLQVLSCLPTPFTDPVYIKLLLGSNESLGIFNAFTGQGFSNLTFMTLSITPYITASIVLELLSVAIRPVSEIMHDKGYASKKKKLILQTGTSALLALMQGIPMAAGYARQGIFTPGIWPVIILAACYWTVGTAVCVLTGWIITEKIIGKGALNGISLILLCNILSSYLRDAQSVYASIMLREQTSGMRAALAVIVVLAVFCLFCFVTACQLCEKKLTLVQSKVIRGGYRAPDTPFSIKLWPGSVVPVIFAAQFYSLPSIIRTVTGAHWKWPNYFSTAAWFDPASMQYTWGALGYVVLIIGFSYYYSGITVNLREVADNFKKSGHTIPGIRPGRQTEEYMWNQMKYVIFIGGLALSAIALVPCMASGLLHVQGIAFLGTSLLITVGVILDTRDYVLSQTKYNAVKAYKKGGFLHG